MKVGDSIVIPKDTLVFDYTRIESVGTKSKRIARGTVKHLFTLNWTRFVDHSFYDIWFRKGITRRWPLDENMPVTHPDVVAEKARIDQMLGGDYDFVSWGDRYAHAAAVQVSAAPKAKEAAVSKRTMMVEGSRWRFNRDTVITAMVDPDRDHRLTKELAAWIAAGRPYDYNDPYRHSYEMPIFTVRAGTEFTVTSSKLASVSRQPSGLAVRTDLRDDQVEFHIQFLRGDGSTGGHGMPGWQYWGENPWWVGELGLPFRQIEDSVDAIHIPETLIYLLKDTETGKYFGDFHDDYSNPRSPVFSFRMVETVKSARKFAKESNAKASILSWTGYLADKGVQPDTFSTTRKADLPDTWVLVPVNKLTLDEGDAIDINAWYRGIEAKKHTE